MLYGDQIETGFGVSTVLMSCDFETYSEAGYVWDAAAQRWRKLSKGAQSGIGIVGAWCYSEHPSTEILCFAYDLKTGAGRQLWTPAEANPTELFERIAAGYLIEAVYSFFEYCIWNNVCVRLYGWPPLHIDCLRDVAAKAAVFTLPRSLEKMAAVLQTPVQKDKAGSTIMKKVSKPRSPSKHDDRQRYTPADSPEDFLKLYDYCLTDVEAEDAAAARLPDLTTAELSYFTVDQHINARGVAIDLETVEAARKIITQAQARYFVELQTLTNGSVQTSDEVAKLKAWAIGRGVSVASIDKEAVVELLARDGVPADVRRVFEIRQIMGSGSVKKTNALSWRTGSDGRARGLYTYCGAGRSSRWAGNGAQPQNLPSGGPAVVRCLSCTGIRWEGLSCCPRCFSTQHGPAEWGAEAAEACRPAIRSGNLATLEAFWGDPFDAIAGCLRSLFIAGPGAELISSDYSSIEAIVMSELTGEEWQREVFATHGKIYEMTAARITGIPFAEFARYKAETGHHHPQRKLGKTASLASMYQGWVDAWLNFGAGEFLTESEIKDAILAWRKANPMVVKFWKEMERCSIAAVEQPGQSFSYRDITFQMHSGSLYCWLISGRPIIYHSPLVQEQEKYGKLKKQLSYAGIGKNKNWMRLDVHGGKITGHVVQATARDIFADAMVRVEAAGYPIVLHTHDEPTAEVAEGTGSIEHYESILSVMPAWCTDWPIKAQGGWRGKRNRK